MEHLYSNTQSPAKLFMPATGWLSAQEVKYVRAVFEVASLLTNLSVEFAYQTANVENSPDTPATAVGSAQTTNGVNYGTLTDISSALASKQLVRFGFLVCNTNAATLVLGRAGGYVEYRDC